MGDSFSFGHPGDLADQFHEGCGDEFILPYLPELVAIAQRLLVNNPRSGNGIPRCVTFVTAWAYEAGKSADTHDGPGEWYVNCDLIGLVDCSRLKEITTVEEVTQ